jgi:hypothetical protein
MKVCKICNCEKPLEDFPFHQKSKGTRRPECRECYNKLRKEKGDPEGKRKKTAQKSYQKHKEARKASVKEYVKRNKKKAYSWARKSLKKRLDAFFEWKSTLKCSQCGENHISCLEFHHLYPSKKEGLISKMRFSPKKLEIELPKCIVLCSNCHRKLHYKLNQERYVQQQENQSVSCEGKEKSG